ncbi:MAG: fibronectin type III domain-containing protein, partial [Chloroflexi bacterium]|nr:fibronectin type III domain-containing protein [Chloroflexota bacterium]
ASTWSARIVDLGNGPNADNVILSRSEGETNLRLEIYHGGSVAGQVTAPNALQIGTWQHLAATVAESGAATIYRNGQVVGSGNLPLPRTVTRSSNFVGRSNWSGDAFFAGRLDEVAIYATALPADRVVAHAEAAIGPPGAPSNVTALAGIEKATITWSPPTGDSRDPILEYTVTSSAGQRLTVPSPATLATLTGLAAGTPHTFTVSTRSSKGVSPVSAASNVVTPTAPPSSAYPLAVLTDQPLGYWRFDESEATQAADSSGNGYTAKYAGTVQTGQPGALRTDSNPTISFDGTDAHVVLPSGFRSFDRGVTFEAWAFPTASTWSARIVDLGNGPNADNVILSRSEGGTDLRFEIYDGGSLAGQIVAPGALVLETWQHLVATVDVNGVATIYRNGQPVATGNVPLPQAVTRSSNYVGRSNWSGDGFFSGRIDEVAIYPAALSAALIQAHYDAAGGTATTSASRERR